MPKVTTEEIVNTMLRTKLPEPTEAGQIFRLVVVRDLCRTMCDVGAPTTASPLCYITLQAAERRGRWGVRRLGWKFDSITGD